MVDIKREDITLSDWTKGISADEFAGGSYYYSDGVQTWYSTKWFKLWYQVEKHTLNNRTTGRPIAVCPCKGSLLDTNWDHFIVFTNDGYLEMDGNLNGGTSWEGWDSGGGAIYEDFWVWHDSWVWGFVYWKYALAFTKTRVRQIDYKNAYNIEYGQAITSPRFENSAAWWTVGTGWTLTDDWMEHTAGNTGTLETTAAATSTWVGRFAVKIADCTAGSVTISIPGDGDLLTTEAWRNGWFVICGGDEHEGVNETITLTPSSDFDGTIEAVNFNIYDDEVTLTGTLTSANKHRAIEWGWDIYVVSGTTIDIISTIDWAISDSKQLVRDDEEIVWITQQGDWLIIWATNGMDSHQYYWNWVDSAPSEVIRWQGQTIKAVTGTEIISYVLTSNGTAWGTAFRLYSVNGYQRSLIASNAYKLNWANWNLEHYHPSKKFVFNDVQGSESMSIYMDSLYLPGCDGIYQFGQTLPGLSFSRSRPIKYDNGADKIFMTWQNLSFTYRLDKRNYYGLVRTDYYTNKWYLVTDSIYRDKLGTRKALEKLKIWYKSLSDTDWKIKIYAIVDDDYFWRFDVTGVTNRPEIGDVYTVARSTKAEVISIDKTNTTDGTITFRTVENKWSLNRADSTLSRVTWDGDASLTTNYNYDNMVLVKTITKDTQCFGSDLIFGKDFVNNYIPYWHKIQLVIELETIYSSYSNQKTPEIYEISMVSDITDIVL